MMHITPYIIIFLLIFVRSLAVVGVAPLLGNAQVPAMFKIGLSGFLALIVATTITTPSLVRTLSNVSLPHLVLLVLQESLVGLAIGLMAGIVFAVVQFAGDIVDIQIGLSMATILSPGMSGSGGLLSTFYYLLFAIWFLAVNGHHAIILALLYSYKVVPIGVATFGGPVSATLLEALSSMFVLGVQFAAPLMLALFLTNVSLAVASKAVPQMNIFVVGLPLTLLIGWLILYAVIPEVVWAMQGLLNTMNQEFVQILQALGGGHA